MVDAPPMRHLQRLYTVCYIVVLGLYGTLLLVPPALSWYAPRVAFHVVYITPSFIYITLQTSVMCFLLAMEAYVAYVNYSGAMVAAYFRRSTLAWVVWLVINCVALAQHTTRPVMGALHTAACVMALVL